MSRFRTFGVALVLVLLAALLAPGGAMARGAGRAQVKPAAWGTGITGQFVEWLLDVWEEIGL